MSDVLDMAPDVCRTPDSPLQRCRSPVSPSLLDSEAERDTVVSPPSPDFVESSQSQSEHELSASWAEVIGLRRAALMRYGQSVNLYDYSPSSPSRPAESQDYDAHDEYSQSQGSYSQASTFAHSELHSSPLCGASQFTDASSSSSLTPYSEVPSQFLDFLSMFENRDEFGNELLAPVEGLSRSAFAPPITREQTRSDECSRASPPSHAYGSPSSPRRDLEDAAPGSSDEVMEESQLGESQDYAEDSDYGSSDIPDVYPTPVRDFLAMFEESQQPVGVAP
ncbi:hypothetical protein BC628DRAFT_1410783 [Trametes gibbosa]|nr:hypothetical protein BC628DRAFT_1410783 [Trametes gibbosa]